MGIGALIIDKNSFYPSLSIKKIKKLKLSPFVLLELYIQSSYNITRR